MHLKYKHLIKYKHLKYKHLDDISTADTAGHAKESDQIFLKNLKGIFELTFRLFLNLSRLKYLVSVQFATITFCDNDHLKYLVSDDLIQCNVC